MDEDRRVHNRWLGALAGLAPTLGVGLLFSGGTAASPIEVATSMALVALISVAAGWLAGPLATARPRRLLVASFGYAIASLAATAVLALVQAAWDVWATNGLDPVAILAAVIWRAVGVFAGAAYLILPAILFGLLWSLTVRGLMRVGRVCGSVPR
jgi:hypothetical protein